MTRCLLSACITNCSSAGWFWKRKREMAESKPRAHQPAPRSATELDTRPLLQDQALPGRSKQLQREVLVEDKHREAARQGRISHLGLQDTMVCPQASLATLHIRQHLTWEDKHSDAIHSSSRRHLIQLWIFSFSSPYTSITALNTNIIPYKCSILLYNVLKWGTGNQVWALCDHFQVKIPAFKASTSCTKSSPAVLWSQSQGGSNRNAFLPLGWVC